MKVRNDVFRDILVWKDVNLRFLVVIFLIREEGLFVVESRYKEWDKVESLRVRESFDDIVWIFGLNCVWKWYLVVG